MTAIPSNLRSYTLAHSAAERFFAAYQSEVCEDRLMPHVRGSIRPIAPHFTRQGIDSLHELAAHLGYRLVPANVVQVGDHPPEHSPDTSKIVAIGDFDPVYQRKLDTVREAVAAPDLGGDAA